jgi:hypothetical protein
MDILDDNYELPMVVRGLHFVSCRHALDACPYFGHEFATAISEETCPTRRETLIARVKVPTHRGAPRWLREINRRIERYTGVTPPAGWNRETAEREVRMVKFGMAVCKDTLLRRAATEQLSPELLAVARELRARSVRVANPLKQFYHLTVTKGPETQSRIESDTIYEELHYAISAPNGARAAALVCQTATDNRIAFSCVPQASNEFISAFLDGLVAGGHQGVAIDV